MAPGKWEKLTHTDLPIGTRTRLPCSTSSPRLVSTVITPASLSLDPRPALARALCHGNARLVLRFRDAPAGASPRWLRRHGTALCHDRDHRGANRVSWSKRPRRGDAQGSGRSAPPAAGPLGPDGGRCRARVLRPLARPADVFGTRRTDHARGMGHHGDRLCRTRVDRRRAPPAVSERRAIRAHRRRHAVPVPRGTPGAASGGGDPHSNRSCRGRSGRERPAAPMARRRRLSTSDSPVHAESGARGSCRAGNRRRRHGLPPPARRRGLQSAGSGRDRRIAARPVAITWWSARDGRRRPGPHLLWSRDVGRRPLPTPRVVPPHGETFHLPFSSLCLTVLVSVEPFDTVSKETSALSPSTSTRVILAVAGSGANWKTSMSFFPSGPSKSLARLETTHFLTPVTSPALPALKKAMATLACGLAAAADPPRVGGGSRQRGAVNVASKV